jgi:hypothetical protein
MCRNKSATIDSRAWRCSDIDWWAHVIPRVPPSVSQRYAGRKWGTTDGGVEALTEDSAGGPARPESESRIASTRRVGRWTIG